MLVSVIPCNHQPTGVVITTPHSNWNPHFVRSSCTRKIPGVSGKFSHPVLGFHMTKQCSKITTSCHQSSQKNRRKVIKTQRFYAREIYEIPAMFSPQGINHGSVFVASRLVFLVEMGLGGKVLQHFVPLAVPQIGVTRNGSFQLGSSSGFLFWKCWNILMGNHGIFWENEKII